MQGSGPCLFKEETHMGVTHIHIFCSKTKLVVENRISLQSPALRNSKHKIANFLGLRRDIRMVDSKK
jgi:hypothetical protein